MKQAFLARWRGAGGYREVLVVAIPLVLSTGSTSILHFVDNVFLTWYSPDALSAAMPASLMSLTLFSFFAGTIGFVNTFVAQYDGSRRPERIGAAVWQGIWLALASALLFLLVIPFVTEPLFRFVGHSPEIQRMEVDYFRILAMAAGLPIFAAALSAFYSGRGKAWPLMWINVVQVLMNIALDYVLIFGKFGFPRMGIRGAAIGTVLSSFCGCGLMTILFLSPTNSRLYGTRSQWRFDFVLVRRLLRFGIPSGAHFFLDIAAFTLFILLIGRLGETELAATNMTFRINLLMFLPMIGFGISTSALVGRYLGAERPDLSERATWSAFQLTVAYMATFAFFYVFFPRWFLLPFTIHAEPESIAAILAVAIVLMRFIAVYSLFDTMSVIFSSALRGAGDTQFVMRFSLAALWLLLVLPVYLIIRFGGSLYAAWVALSFAIAVLGVGLMLRFMSGKWRTMRVIGDEERLIAPPTVVAAEEGMVYSEIIPDSDFEQRDL